MGKKQVRKVKEVGPRVKVIREVGSDESGKSEGSRHEFFEEGSSRSGVGNVMGAEAGAGRGGNANFSPAAEAPRAAEAARKLYSSSSDESGTRKNYEILGMEHSSPGVGLSRGGGIMRGRGLVSNQGVESLRKESAQEIEQKKYNFDSGTGRRRKGHGYAWER